MPGTWSEEDDRTLWSQRSKPTAQLASAFGKSNGAIRSRLKHLQDPSHKAYKRRVKASATSSSSCRVIDLTGASPFAASYIAAKSSSSSAYTSTNNGMSSFAANCHASEKFASSTPASSLLLSPSSQKNESSQPHIDPSSLNNDQKAASKYIFSGGNAFLTGAAGVGKSYLLRYLIQGLRDKYPEQRKFTDGYRPSDASRVVVAATTGIAATHVNGVTIHSWSGVRLGVGGARVLVPRVLQNEAACQRWRKAEVLILDEVSMIDGMFFEALDTIGREVRGCYSKPFGGIQLVLSGDFFQLPPVSLNKCGFAFETSAWRNAAVKMVELRTVVRQSGDTTFINLLNQIRVGQCPSEITQALEACHVTRKPLPVDGIVPTKLYCTNKNVDVENNRNLAALPGREMVFEATDSFKGNYTRDAQKKITQVMDKKMPSQLRLKVGAQVILTRNMPGKKLVNGSRGVVKSFQESRMSDFDEIDIVRHSRTSTKLYPVVHFSNGVKMVVCEEEVFQGGSSGAMVRSQLPLKLAWSLTVHKSQGMTIERAELQLDDAFDYGQVYVALSRVTSLDGLWVRGGRITQSVVKSHPKVMAFYKQNGSVALANA